MKIKTLLTQCALGSLLLCAPAFAVNTLTNGLVTHLTFDGNVLDTSGKGANGDLVGAPVYETGILGKAIHIISDASAGTNDYVTLNYPDVLKFGSDATGDATDYTIAFWVKVLRQNDDQAFVSNKNWNSGGNPGWVAASKGGGMKINYRDDASGRRDSGGDFGPELNDKNWHHLAVVFVRRGAIMTYIDGTLRDTVSIVPDAGQPIGSADTADLGLFFNIGQDGTGTYTDNGTAALEAVFDDFGVWRRALAADEVRRIFAGASAQLTLSQIPDPEVPTISASFPVNDAIGVGPGVVISITIKDSATKLVTNSVQFFFDGTKVTPVLASGTNTTSFAYDPPGILLPLSQHTARIVYTDTSTPAVTVTNDIKFTVGDYKNILLPAPIAFEDFENVAEGSLPAGWSVTNYTSGANGNYDLNDPNSDAYLDWVVITRDRVAAITAWNPNDRLSTPPGLVENGVEITSLVSNKFIYAESDQRGGSQVQYLFTPDFNLGGKSNIYVSYHSMYTQNQDNIGSVEYSLDGGTNWLPVVYMIDRVDIMDASGGPGATGTNVDAVVTLTTPQSDTASYSDPVTGELIGGTYGAFIAAPISQALAPFISGRVNDDQSESKRIELFRLPGADGKSKIRFRFAQAGTGSWFFGIDNFGVYSIAPALGKPAQPTITGPASIGAFASTLDLGGSAFVGGKPGDTQLSSIWQISASSAFASSNGLATPLITFTSTAGNLKAAVIDLANKLQPGKTYYATVQYADQTGTKSDFAQPVSFAVDPLPAPIVFEDFESAPEFGIPAGWAATNQTDTGHPGLDPADPESDTYLGWVVVPFSSLTAFGGARDDASVASGKSLYSESDNRGGNQIDIITTPDYNLSGKSGVWLAFKSNWRQNQDSIALVEYSTDKGTSWKPVVYMVNDKPSNTDIVRNADGSINASATLTTTAGDIAKVIDPATGARVAAGKYADFILAGPIDSLAPYISGRIDDDTTESKRFERFRLPAADNQAAVRLRFVHAGTGSWYWGLDDVGLYAAGAGGVHIDSIVKNGAALTINWSGGSGPYLLQKKAAVNGAAWMNVLTTAGNTATVVSDGAAGFFRVSAGATNVVIPLTVSLSGLAEKPAALTNSASGAGTVSIEGNTLSYMISFKGLSGPATAGHIHGFAPASGTASPIITFTTPAAASGTVSGTATLTEAQKTAILAGQSYANFHTAANGGGEIRGQIIQSNLRATLNGASEKPNAVNTAATGSAALTLVGNQLLYGVSYNGLSGAPTASHIHGPADATAAAGVIIPFTGLPTTASGSFSGSVTVTPAQLGYIADGLTYVNIHTAANGGGEIRGQIAP